VTAGEMPPVRALTLGVESRHPLGRSQILQAAEALFAAGRAFEAEGYEVQTLRLSTRPVLGDLVGWEEEALAGYAASLQEHLAIAGVEFCSLGPALPALGPGRVLVLARMLAGNGALSASAMVATPQGGLDFAMARASAEAVLWLAEHTDRGLGNFNFAALAYVAPGTPFFPAAYHSGPGSFSVCLQGASVIAGALAGGADLEKVESRVGAALRRAAHPVVELAEHISTKVGVSFAGIDLSPAPDVDDSIVEALELAGQGAFGEPGTLALAAAVTAGLRSTGLPACGYSGLMLPLMEDRLLARRWEEGRVSLDQLLAWSAVCGTGLDTVPVPGDTPVGLLAKVIADVASLAARLGKPLSARLLPAPGKRVGEMTAFGSPYLVDTLLKALGRVSPS
jgi:uncharacterized protein (UPF0210 family)